MDQGRRDAPPKANRPTEVNMSSTHVGSATSTEMPELSMIDMALEVVTVPVADVDRAKSFYQRLGWRLDIDLVISDDLRSVQMTPPHSQCSIHFGKGLTTMEPGSLERLYLAVKDIDAARALLLRVRVVQRPRWEPLGAPGGHDPPARARMGGLTN